MFKGISGLAIGTILMATGASAVSVQVQPTSYDMLNGETGSYQYWDEDYTGTGNTTTSLAPLSGGVGDLTDGVIATQNWNVVEQPPGNGPYVGWVRVNPVITFNFAKVYEFVSATFYVDDSNNTGGVRPPQEIVAAGRSVQVADPASAEPFAVTIDLTGITTDTISTQLFRRGNVSWVFLSEVEFEAVAMNQVPLPAGALLLGSALGAFGVARKRRKGTR